MNSSTLQGRQKQAIVDPRTTTSSSTLSLDASVAIVGAGFAGLALANVLKREGNSCTLFESKTDPVPRTVGQIQLPFARQLLEHLNLCHGDTRTIPLRSLDQCNEKGSFNQDVYEQHLFLQLLRNQVSIEYGFSVTDFDVVMVNENGQALAKNGAAGVKQSDLSLRSWFCLRNRETGQEWGPFHTLVVADGLLGSFSTELIRAWTQRLKNNLNLNTMNPWLQIQTALIGDARWAHQHVGFWDFGQRRRRFGGNVALRDAMEVATLLAQGASTTTGAVTCSSQPSGSTYGQQQEKKLTSRIGSLSLEKWNHVMGKFHPQFVATQILQRRHRQRQWTIGLVLIVLAVLLGGKARSHF